MKKIICLFSLSLLVSCTDEKNTVKTLERSNFKPISVGDTIKAENFNIVDEIIFIYVTRKWA